MKSPITEAFEKARAAGSCAFIPFMTGGFPDMPTCYELVKALDDAGADVIEVGLPFSDPLADGPTIQKAGRVALDNGTTPETVLHMIAELRPDIKAPIVLMTYLNPVMRMGFERFAKRCEESGVAGTIIPDLPVEEAASWLNAARKHGIDTIFMAAPTTTPDRARRIASDSSGFLYYVSMTGVTGSAFVLSDETRTKISQLREIAPVPVAVGFGISTASQAKALAGVADGVIVGSALIRAVQDRESPEEQIASVSSLAADLARALKTK